MHVFQDHTMSKDSLPGYSLGLWTLDLGRLETIARFIFTMAALCDIWSMSIVDSSVTSL